MLRSMLRGASCLSCGLICLSVHMTYGQSYPSKPIRVLTSEPGSGPDFIARLVAQGITAGLGQQVVVDNRVGGAVLLEAAARMPADGYTLVVTGNPLWLLPLMQSVSYDAARDFAPITYTSSSPNIVVVYPTTPITSIKDLVASAKASPGKLNYSSGPSGSSNHLAAELFKSMTAVNMVRIPYKGSGQALLAVIGGETQVMFSPTAGAIPQIKSGKVRALAVTSAQPSSLAPGLPTVAASGVPGYEVVSLDAIFAPANTPPEIIARLNQEIVRYITRQDTRQKLFDSGLETVGSSVEELAAKMKTETATWSKVIKDAGIVRTD